jgi:hypothetical protein
MLSDIDFVILLIKTNESKYWFKINLNTIKEKRGFVINP